ncbi:hypothetical protein FACS1894133_4730 [Clostridia bacterium]|nr:hypothetical protein FACS1894133_4730 [Clostridia bacterium]
MKGLILLGVAAVAGIGYVIGKKRAEDGRQGGRGRFGGQERDRSFRDVSDIHNCDCDCGGEDLDYGEADNGARSEDTLAKYKEKLRNASLFAVGAAKTGAEKVADGVSEGFREITKGDMVKKGTDAVDAFKRTAGDIATDVKHFGSDVIGAVGSFTKKAGNAAEVVVDGTADVASDVAETTADTAAEAAAVFTESYKNDTTQA